MNWLKQKASIFKQGFMAGWRRSLTHHRRLVRKVVGFSFRVFVVAFLTFLIDRIFFVYLLGLEKSELDLQLQLQLLLIIVLTLEVLEKQIEAEDDNREINKLFDSIVRWMKMIDKGYRYGRK